MASGTINNGDYTEEDDSSGDYRILDPQGNVIFRWDESNGEWNLENNPITNLSSLSTADAEITNGSVSTDPTNPTTWAIFGADRAVIQHNRVTDIAGDNSAVQITNIEQVQSGSLLVLGQRESDDSAFSDEMRLGGARIGQIDRDEPRGTTGTRSYSRSGFDISLAIDDAGETYNVTVIGQGGSVAP